MLTETKTDLVWKALADSSRRTILDHLAESARTTGELIDLLPQLSRTAVMKHLGILVEAGLVLVRRDGRKRWNILNPLPIQAIHERWVAKYLALQASRLLRLKEVTESKHKRNNVKEQK